MRQSLLKSPLGWKIAASGLPPVSTSNVVGCTLAGIGHDPTEILRCDPLNNDIPYDWSLKQC